MSMGQPKLLNFSDVINNRPNQADLLRNRNKSYIQTDRHKSFNQADHHKSFNQAEQYINLLHRRYIQ